MSGGSGQTASAAEKLQLLLLQLDHAGSPSSPMQNSSLSKASKDTPKTDELVILLQASEEISHRLQNENVTLHNDITKLRSNVVALVEENNKLHEEIRTTFVSDMLRLVTADGERQATDKESQVVDLYAKKMRSIEIDLKDAKEKLAMYESVWQAPNDLMNCLKCGSPLPLDTGQNSEKYTNLVTENEANKRKVEQIQHKLEQSQIKENATLSKLQECIIIVEQSQFEKTEAIVEREQLKMELNETKQRLKNTIDDISNNIMGEKQAVERDCEQRINENVEAIKKLEEKCAQYEVTIDRLAREKTSLATDLDNWKNRIQRQEIDLSLTTDTVKLEIQKAMRERDQANSGAMKIRNDYEKLLSQSNQDTLQLRQQLNSVQNRSYEIENDLLNSKKYCLELTEETNRLTRESIMLKSVKQSLEKSREDNMDAIVVILRQREDDYRQTIENLEIDRKQSLSVLEDLVTKQNVILNKLRLYSKQLTTEIETILRQKNQLVEQITIENQELRMKLSNAYERLETTDVQLLKHNDTHIKLKERLIELNTKVKDYENMIDKLKAKDLMDYQQPLALISQRT
ncbi:unnamed protein product [Didymodactylos carnosus]|uniref:Uncharacterized protein n=1 Tax=Didymodactylos carnosus TaxID=1234261 RepID=A0A8S2N6S7_9BILA|nr:unnamed protein product [Didymodactylos carnosus]CAF3989349.1 unnamed protein product [Didymodactylos carnosus]